MALRLDIDHAVIAVRDLDAAAAGFTALGFTLTPRGFHSIGSQNHCIMLGSTYIELLAAPTTHPWLEHYRAFLDRQGDGLAAVALSTDDADRAYAELKDQGARAPMELSRPVEGGVARFRLVQVRDNLFVCQHLTRELVWRPEWQKHANGASELIAAAWREKRPFEGLPRSIEWQAPAALRLRGLRAPLEAHGVRLAPA